MHAGVYGGRGVLQLVLATFQYLLLTVLSPAQNISILPPMPERLVVGSELDFPPFALVTGDKQADGFTVELWKAVAHEAGLDSTILTGPFHEILQDFKKGSIDVMINLAQSPERAGFCSFSVPHVTIHGAIFTRRGEAAVRSEADLPGKSLIVLNRDLAHDYAIGKGWTNRLVLVDDAASGFAMLASGKHDAFLVGKLVGLKLIREKQYQNIVPVGQRVDFHQKFAFAVMKGRPGSSELLERINEGLALVKANGTYDALYIKWFGILEPTAFDWRQFLRYLLPAVLLALLATGAYMVERRLRRQLKQVVSLLNATLESTAEGVLAIDAAGNITASNRKLWEFGFMPSVESTGGPIRGPQFFDSFKRTLGNPDELETTLRRVSENCEEETLQTLHLIDQRCFAVASNPQRIDSRYRGRVWSFRDITEQENAAARIRQFARELETKVLERTSQLELALRSRENFMAAISHELRTPLHGILGLAEMLSERTYGPISPKQERALRGIEQSGQHLLALINDILDAIQIKEVGASLEVADCDVLELCEAAVQIIEPSVQKKGQKLLLQLPEKGVVLRMDPRRMRQVLVNLLSNALKFTSMDGEIGLAVRRVPGEIQFEVSDTGVGIPAEHLGRLFKPFVQLNESLSREQGGTGLGLALVDQLVKAHGGRVEVQSTVGTGSRFTVILPVKESTTNT